TGVKEVRRSLTGCSRSLPLPRENTDRAKRHKRQFGQGKIFPVHDSSGTPRGSPKGMELVTKGRTRTQRRFTQRAQDERRKRPSMVPPGAIVSHCKLNTHTRALAPYDRAEVT